MSKKKPSVAVNIVMNFFLTISNLVFPLVTFPYVSRVLLPVGTGKVAFVTSIVSYFAMIGMLGIPTYGIRACAKVRDDKEQLSKTVQEILVINTIAMTISLALYLIALLTVPRMAQDRTLFLINITTLIFNVIGCEWLYKALEQYTYITIRSIALKVVSLILMFVLVRTQEDYVMYGAITILASVGANAFNFINLRHHLSLKWYPEMALKQHIAPIFSFFMMTIATTIYTNLDSVMLGFMKGDEAVGYYNAAVKIKGILVSLVTSMGAVLLPRLSYYVKQKNQEAFDRLTVRSLQFIGFVAIPLVVYFIAFAREGIVFLSGDQYAGAIIPMQLIMPTLLLIGISNLLGIQILVPMDREMDVVKSVTLGAVVDLVINLVAIPRFGAAGAAFGTLVAEVFVTFYQMVVLRDLLGRLAPKVAFWKNALATLVGMVVAVSLSQGMSQSTSAFIRLVVTGGSFGLVYLIMSLALKDQFISYLWKYVRHKEAL